MIDKSFDCNMSNETDYIIDSALTHHSVYAQVKDSKGKVYDVIGQEIEEKVVPSDPTKTHLYWYIIFDETSGH